MVGHKNKFKNLGVLIYSSSLFLTIESLPNSSAPNTLLVLFTLIHVSGWSLVVSCSRLFIWFFFLTKPCCEFAANVKNSKEIPNEFGEDTCWYPSLKREKGSYAYSLRVGGIFCLILGPLWCIHTWCQVSVKWKSRWHLRWHVILNGW